MELLAGRLHPVLVHLPIGFLLMAFLFELLGLSKRRKKLRRAVPAALHLGIIAGVFAISSGFLLAEEGGQDDNLLFRHKLFSILSVAGAALLALLIGLAKSLAGKAVRMLLFIFMVTCLTLAGHFGGSMTHGKNYLLADTGSQSAGEVKLPDRTASANSDLLIYRDLVRPILAEKCYSCHSDRRQKGKLRLDSEAAIKLGGKNGPILDGRSELVNRISLSVEEEGHMPPREKDQLTSMEIGILTAWVRDGASFTMPADSVASQIVKDALHGMSANKPEESSWLPDVTGVDLTDEDELKADQIPGIRITPVSVGSPWLEVVATGSEKWGEGQWKVWDKYSALVVSARFSFSGITDDQMLKIAQARNLRRLYIDHTDISDAGIRNLKNAQNLQRISISATRITDNAVKILGELPGLNQIFAAECRLNDFSVVSFRKSHPAIELETGTRRLPVLRTDTLEFR